MADLNFRDLGETYDGPSAATSPSSEKYYPSTCLDLDDFPELKDLDVSDTVQITFKCKVRNKMESEDSSTINLDLMAASIDSIDKAKAVSTADAIQVKNDADVALEAISAIKRKM